MGNGSSFNYDFGAKRNWRRWAWNRIAERVADKSNALCLYLPSSNDEDRPIAISRVHIKDGVFELSEYVGTDIR
jgi:hypothetical protein